MRLPKTDQNQLQIFDHQQDQVTQIWQPIRDDFNFCRLALFVAGDKNADRFRDITYDYDLKINGKAMTARWEVHHDRELGLLGAFDRDVWWGILDLVEEITGGDRNKVPEIIHLGSPKAFLNRIDKPYNGKYIGMFNESIKRLLRTVCFSDNAFNCPETGGYLRLMKTITLITEAGFKGEPDEKTGKLHETTWIKLGDYVLKNLKSGYIALIDVKYVRLLKSELAKLLYPLLSYRFWLAVDHGRDRYFAHWHQLRDYLAVNGWDTLARARDRLKPAFAELMQNDYIDASSHWADDTYVFVPGNKFLDELATRFGAKARYEDWVAGKHLAKQLTLVPNLLPVSAPVSYTADDERTINLTRQAIRIAHLNKEPDVEILAKSGWTRDDAYSLAQTLKQGK
jgi:hypothetical protein